MIEGPAVLVWEVCKGIKVGKVSQQSWMLSVAVLWLGGS